MSNKLINLVRSFSIGLSVIITLIMIIFIIYSEIFYKQVNISKQEVKNKKIGQILITEYESLKLDYISQPENINVGLKEKIKEIDLKRSNKKSK
ncbi:hypothetical protein [Clostridium tarantellae]|uniref:Uncharacterized protein n=1 Tax=Clostridium tarantellae TaxID=39493 RepID=A0A6I1MY09_9CLOT|nr:hypothetical protein [Clostridium tarantellae]MPQ45019.1 hypothetical protein [Clostridium tarantellae]